MTRMSYGLVHMSLGPQVLTAGGVGIVIRCKVPRFSKQWEFCRAW